MIYNITMNLKNIDKNTTTYIDTDNKTMNKIKLYITKIKTIIF